MQRFPRIAACYRPGRLMKEGVSYWENKSNTVHKQHHACSVSREQPSEGQHRVPTCWWQYRILQLWEQPEELPHREGTQHQKHFHPCGHFTAPQVPGRPSPPAPGYPYCFHLKCQSSAISFFRWERRPRVLSATESLHQAREPLQRTTCKNKEGRGRRTYGGTHT